MKKSRQSKPARDSLRSLENISSGWHVSIFHFGTEQCGSVKRSPALYFKTNQTSSVVPSRTLIKAYCDYCDKEQYFYVIMLSTYLVASVAK